MLNTYEARTDEEGNIILNDQQVLPEGCRVLVTVLNDEVSSIETMIISEDVLTADWNKTEEDEAWKCLNPET